MYKNLLCHAWPIRALFLSVIILPATLYSQSDLDVETYELSPFAVTSESTVGYHATETLAATRLRTKVRDVGSALTIITEQFLKDTGVKNNEDLLVYTPSTEVGGLDGNYSGAGNRVVETDSNNRVRGLGSADNTRDFFLSDIPWDAYNIDRVALQRGPNSILFGLGKPAGLVNASLKQASFIDSNSIEARIGSYGSKRVSVNINRELVDEQLAVRVAGLSDHAEYRQDPAFKNDERLYGALRYEPKFLNGDTAHTSFRLNYEHGSINSNNPNVIPPADRISPWFQTGTTNIGGKEYNNLNQGTIDFRYNRSYFPDVPGSGSLAATSPNFQPYLEDFFGGQYAFFGDLSSAQTTGNYYVPDVSRTQQNGIGPDGTIDRVIGGLFGNNHWSGVADTTGWALTMSTLGLPYAAAYENESITDPSIFNFYNLLIEGPNKREHRSWDAYNFVFSQTFWNNRLGIEAVYDQQEYQSWKSSIFGGGDGSIGVDVNELLPDFTPNPNLGRPFIRSRTIGGGGGQQTERDNYRVTVYAELRAEDVLPKESWFTRLLGRHVFTGVNSSSAVDVANQSWGTHSISNSPSGLLNDESFLINEELNVIQYIGPDLRGRSSPAGLNLSNAAQMLNPQAGTMIAFDSRWNHPLNPDLSGYVDPAAPWVNPFNNQTITQSENPANYVGWVSPEISILSDLNGDRQRLTTNAAKNRDDIDSNVFVWQGYLWDGLIVPTYGYREDTASASSVIAPTDARGIAEQHSLDYVLPARPSNRVKGNTKSYSIVVHTPEFIRERLPYGLNLSLFYNKSSNFEPAAGRVDVLNQPLAPPTGETKDYGFVVSALNDKVTLKLNKYESGALNATYGVPGGAFLGVMESRTWVLAKRYEAGLSGDPLYSGSDYNYGTIVDGVFVQTDADRTLQRQVVDATLAAFAPEIWEAWNMEPTEFKWQTLAQAPWSNGLPGAVPVGLTGSADTLSKGYEAELFIRPTKNWNIVINASRTEASRENVLGGTNGQWIEARNEIWSGIAGQLRRYDGVATRMMGPQWNQQVYNKYLLAKQLEGLSAPEIRKWRFNLVNNYRFDSGKLKNVNVGGAFRWEDNVTVGYPSITATVGEVEAEIFDVANPYHGPTASKVDLWAGYSRELNNRINWNIQVNLRNAFGENELIPINAQPDGSAAGFRIQQGMTWMLTNTFDF